MVLFQIGLTPIDLSVPGDVQMSEQKTIETVAGPEAGSRWFRPNSRGIGFVVNHPAETRHVIDRNLGGDVFFVSGRLTRFAHRQRCTLSEWLDWAHDAKQIRT